MTAIQKWLAALAATAAAVVIAYQWLDRPISLFANGRLIQQDTYSELTHIPDPFIPAAVIIFVALGLWTAVRPAADKDCGDGAVMQHQRHRRRGHQEPAQIHLRTDLAGHLDPEQPVVHSRRRLWLQPVPRRPRLHVVSLRAFDLDLLDRLGAVDRLSEIARALCAGGCRRDRRPCRRQLSFPQRYHRRRLCRHVDRLDGDEAMADAAKQRHRAQARAASPSRPNTANTSGLRSRL